MLKIYLLRQLQIRTQTQFPKGIKKISVSVSYYVNQTKDNNDTVSR